MTSTCSNHFEESCYSSYTQTTKVSVCARPVNSTQFGLWVSDITVLSEMAQAELDALTRESNIQCEDLATSLPLLNHLRALDATLDAVTVSVRGYIMRNESIQSCEDVKPYCDSITKMPEFTVDGGHLPDLDLEGVSSVVSKA